jgi:SAM-dependent methyltransferase
VRRIGHSVRVVEPRTHWDDVYSSRAPEELSWYESLPAVSLRFVETLRPAPATVVDVGAGTSHLVDALLSDGYEDVTVLDVSATALDEVRKRLGDRATTVRFVEQDVLSWRPGRVFDVWHDRAVFHFQVAPRERAQYVRVASECLAEDGVAVLATFAEDGPEQCSGLPVARYSAASLAATFPSLSLVAAERVEHRTPSGLVQPFTYVALRRATSDAMKERGLRSS